MKSAKLARSSEKTVISDPYKDPSEMTNTMFCAIVTPVIRHQKFQGTTCVELSIQEICKPITDHLNTFSLAGEIAQMDLLTDSGAIVWTLNTSPLPDIERHQVDITSIHDTKKWANPRS